MVGLHQCQERRQEEINKRVRKVKKKGINVQSETSYPNTGMHYAMKMSYSERETKLKKERKFPLYAL